MVDIIPTRWRESTITVNITTVRSDDSIIRRSRMEVLEAVVVALIVLVVNKVVAHLTKRLSTEQLEQQVPILVIKGPSTSANTQHVQQEQHTPKQHAGTLYDTQDEPIQEEGTLIDTKHAEILQTSPQAIIRAPKTTPIPLEISSEEIESSEPESPPTKVEIYSKKAETETPSKMVQTRNKWSQVLKRRNPLGKYQRK